MPQRVTMESLPQAFEVIKQMQDQGYDWGEINGKELENNRRFGQASQSIEQPKLLPMSAAAHASIGARRVFRRSHLRPRETARSGFVMPQLVDFFTFGRLILALPNSPS